MNNKQQKTLFVGGIIVILSLIIWLISGGEIVTKTQVPVEVQSELEKQLGVSGTEWKNTFIWGLDLTLLISGVTSIICGILFLKFKKEKTNSELSSK